MYGSEGTAEMRDNDTLVINERGKNELVRTFNKIDIKKAELELFCDNINRGNRFSIPKKEIVNVSSFLEASILSCKLNMQIDLVKDLRDD